MSATDNRKSDRNCRWEWLGVWYLAGLAGGWAAFLLAQEALATAQV